MPLSDRGGRALLRAGRHAGRWGAGRPSGDSRMGGRQSKMTFKMAIIEVSVAVAKARLSAMLQAVEAGQEVIITRRGRPVARLSAAERPLRRMDFSRADALRERQAPGGEPSARWLRRLRDEARH